MIEILTVGEMCIRDSYRKYVTIRDMMTHVSGIQEYFEENKWLNIPDSATADTKRMLEIIKGFGDLTFKPRTQYSYCNSSYVMLGNIVEQLSGMSFGEFLKKNIFQPLGMEHTIAPDYMDVKGENLTEGYVKDADGNFVKQDYNMAVSYTHLDVYKRQSHIQGYYTDRFRIWLVYRRFRSALRNGKSRSYGSSPFLRKYRKTNNDNAGFRHYGAGSCLLYSSRCV